MIEPLHEQRVRFAINRDWSVDLTDPRNAAYLIPFGNTKRERDAVAMADIIYGAIADERFTDATPQTEADAAYFQALADSRRMLADPEYMGLFRWGMP
jgi:hypothetical protein